MSSASETVATTGRILKPYTPDPETKSHKRWRLLVVVLVVLFCLVFRCWSRR